MASHRCVTLAAAMQGTRSWQRRLRPRLRPARLPLLGPCRCENSLCSCSCSCQALQDVGLLMLFEGCNRGCSRGCNAALEAVGSLHAAHVGMQVLFASLCTTSSLPTDLVAAPGCADALIMQAPPPVASATPSPVPATPGNPDVTLDVAMRIFGSQIVPFTAADQFVAASALAGKPVCMHR